jgi:hypothetical protein
MFFHGTTKCQLAPSSLLTEKQPAGEYLAKKGSWWIVFLPLLQFEVLD